MEKRLARAEVAGQHCDIGVQTVNAWHTANNCISVPRWMPNLNRLISF